MANHRGYECAEDSCVITNATGVSFLRRSVSMFLNSGTHMVGSHLAHILLQTFGTGHI